jgi:putative ABC transport system permease protein
MSRMSLAVRTSGPPLALAPAVRATVRQLDPQLPVEGFEPMSRLETESMADRRYPTFLLTIFAGLAVLVAAIGVYAVLAFSVEQRTREIGIRLALGAERRQVLRLVLRRGLVLVAVGLALGTAGGAVASRALSRLLFRVAPADPFTTACVILVLFLVSLLAMFLPARRAIRVEPTTALKHE